MTVSLTESTVVVNAERRLAPSDTASGPGARWQFGAMLHADGATLQRVMSEANRVLALARAGTPSEAAPSDDQVRALMSPLGGIHGWLANAMPGPHGSAAKAEMPVRAWAHAQGIDLPPFKRGVSPDIEAFLLPRQWCQAGGYDTLFESRPTVLGNGQKTAESRKTPEKQLLAGADLQCFAEPTREPLTITARSAF